MKNPVILNAYHYSAHDAIVRDRIILTTIMAVGIHVLVILGVAFEWRADNELGKRFDVTFVNTQSMEIPEEARQFAAADQIGGGDGTYETPRTLSESMLPSKSFRPAEVMPTPQTSLQTPQQQSERVMASSEDRIYATRVDPSRRSPSVENHMTATQLYARSMEIASLDVPLSDELEQRGHGANERIAPNTHAHVEAGYRDSWRRKVEKVGTLNFPIAAKQMGITGSLEMDVAINVDGSVQSINILQSSGYKVLDQAAVRIVRLAAPFSPLPEEIKNYAEQLHITHRWRFIPGTGLVGR